MKLVTVFVDDGPLEGFTIECGSWDIGHCGELMIYNDDARPGKTIKGGFGIPPIMIPPGPPSLKIVYANGKWSCVKEVDK